MEPTPTPTPESGERPGKTGKILVIAALAAASMAAVPAVASAQGGKSAEATTGVTAQITDVDQDVADDGASEVAEADLDEFDLSDIEDESSPEELAEFQALEEELAAELDEAGIDYEWVEEEGFRWIEIDWEDDEAVELVDAFYDEHFPLTEEDIAEINAETEELIDALEAAGVPVEVETDEDGLIEFDIPSDDEAVFETADEVLAEFYGDEYLDFEDCDHDEDAE